MKDNWRFGELWRRGSSQADHPRHSSTEGCSRYLVLAGTKPKDGE